MGGQVWVRVRGPYLSREVCTLLLPQLDALFPWLIFSTLFVGTLILAMALGLSSPARLLPAVRSTVEIELPRLATDQAAHLDALSAEASPPPAHPISAAGLREATGQAAVAAPTPNPPLPPLTASEWKHLYAKYLASWQNRVLAIAQAHYPKEVLAQGLKGAVVVAVTVVPNGHVAAVRILQSSGNPILDDAVRNIVEKAEPFPPLPAPLQERHQALEIVRTWNFT